MRALFDEAEAAFKAAAHAFSIPKTDRGSDRARLAGLALAFQANHCISQCNNDEAVVLAGHALEFLDEKREPRETAFAILTWGVALVWSGKEQQGFDACKSAIQLYRTTDDGWGTARALNVFGMECRDWAGPVTSEAYYRESIAIQQALGNQTVFMPNSLRGLGYVRIEQGDYAEGLRLLHEALALCERIGDRWCERICLR